MQLMNSDEIVKTVEETQDVIEYGDADGETNANINAL
jgi:hypothetical protein